MLTASQGWPHLLWLLRVPEPGWLHPQISSSDSGASGLCHLLCPLLPAPTTLSHIHFSEPRYQVTQLFWGLLFFGRWAGSSPCARGDPVSPVLTVTSPYWVSVPFKLWAPGGSCLCLQSCLLWLLALCLPHSKAQEVLVESIIFYESFLIFLHTCSRKTYSQ